MVVVVAIAMIVMMSVLPWNLLETTAAEATTTNQDQEE